MNDLSKHRARKSGGICLIVIAYQLRKYTQFIFIIYFIYLYITCVKRIIHKLMCSNAHYNVSLSSSYFIIIQINDTENFLNFDHSGFILDA